MTAYKELNNKIKTKNKMQLLKRKEKRKLPTEMICIIIYLK